ncbi:KEOPS complex subunit Pcc1 [Halostella litorea]|uniref:KEOPS complex subunit Pcc1 n=1 Tax=Halostella litorea TaxID=2528831 RepID=UPI0010926EA7|nr:KEOPS complex subunit Pcc1 [Halostella litorea]
MPAFVHDATFTFDYDSAARARTVERSVRQEVGEIDGDRSAAAVSRDGATVTVTVEAADPVALRAGINTWLSLVDVAERVAAGQASSSRAASR